jgi:protein O-mannosyl-transferase
VCYANALRAPFVFDDYGSIVDNDHVRHVWPIGGALAAPPQSALAGRPIPAFTFALTYAIGGLDPAWYRAGNLIIHIAAGLLLFGVVRRTFGAHEARRPTALDDWTAGACALIWLVHPLHTEVIDYVTQRTEAIAGAALLLTLYASIRVSSAPSIAAQRAWTALAITACATGMASKESMVVAPVLVLLYDVVFLGGSLRAALRARRSLHAGLALTWTVLIALIAAGPRSHSAGFSSGVTPWVYLLQQPHMIARYLALTIWPTPLVVDYGPAMTVAAQEALPYALVVLALGCGAVVLWRRDRRLGCVAAGFFLTLAPTSSIVPIATEVGAERRMYVPLAALVILATLAIRGTRSRFVSTAAIVIALTLLTIARNDEYRSETVLWQTVLARYPHGRAHYQLGVALRAEGNRDAAIEQYRESLPDCPDGHYALAFELANDGHDDEAVAHLREYIRLLPDVANTIRARTLLAGTLLRTGRARESEEVLQALLRMQANDRSARGLLGDALLGQQRYADAEREYRARLALGPDEAAVRQNLGIALVGQEREAEALAEFTRAVALAPEDARAHRSLGNALASAGRLDEAIQEYRRALALSPGDRAIQEALELVTAARVQERE